MNDGSLVDVVAVESPGEKRPNAAPEWQARSYGYRSRLEGGLSTRGACSKVSHLNWQLLQAFASPSDLRLPPFSLFTL